MKNSTPRSTQPHSRHLFVVSSAAARTSMRNSMVGHIFSRDKDHSRYTNTLHREKASRVTTRGFLIYLQAMPREHAAAPG